MTAPIRTTSPSHGHAGHDRRLAVYDMQHRDLSRNVYTTTMETRTEVEVQPFIQDGTHDAHVSLCLFVGWSETTVAGSADMFLSPDEARLVARMLIVAAEEAEALTEADRQAAGAWA